MGIIPCNEFREQGSGVRDQKRNELGKGWRFDLRSAGVDENGEQGGEGARERGARERDDREQPVANSGWLGDLLFLRPVS
jgi:hypothetical protein